MTNLQPQLTCRSLQLWRCLENRSTHTLYIQRKKSLRYILMLRILLVRSLQAVPQLPNTRLFFQGSLQGRDGQQPCTSQTATVHNVFLVFTPTAHFMISEYFGVCRSAVELDQSLCFHSTCVSENKRKMDGAVQHRRGKGEGSCLTSPWVIAWKNMSRRPR